MRLKQHSATKPCYYCGGNPPSTREHAPPKLMFAAFDCDSITVPSCDKHNNNKAGRDRAIVTWLVKSIDRTLQSGVPESSLSPKAIRAINDLRPNFSQANAEISDQSFLIDSELDLKIPAINFDYAEWIRQLSAALIWSVAGYFDPYVKWNEAFVWNPLYLQGPDRRELLNVLSDLWLNQISEWNIENFDWKNGWSAFPRSYPSELYNFSVCFSPTLVQEIENEVAFRHQFYGCLNFYIWFAPSGETRKLLQLAASK